MSICRLRSVAALCCGWHSLHSTACTALHAPHCCVKVRSPTRLYCRCRCKMTSTTSMKARQVWLPTQRILCWNGSMEESHRLQTPFESGRRPVWVSALLTCSVQPHAFPSVLWLSLTQTDGFFHDSMYLSGAQLCSAAIWVSYVGNPLLSLASLYTSRRDMWH